jgi:hypothetical protein
MTDQTALATTRHIDSLSANEFAVEIDGARVTGVVRVNGLRAFRLEIKPAQTKLMHDAFKLSKLVQHDAENPFNRWLRETLNAKEDIVRPKRTLAIIALDDGRETRRFTVKNAWIGEIAYSDFDSAKSDLVEETLTIYFEDIAISWGETDIAPATPS